MLELTYLRSGSTFCVSLFWRRTCIQFGVNFPPGRFRIVDVFIAMLQTGLCRQEREATFLYIVFNMDSTTRYHLCVPLIALPGTSLQQGK